MTVFAPFRFAPIHRWVYFPEWGPLVSHDVPFKDGLSGEIELEIKAATPLLVGGARRKPKAKKDISNDEQQKWPNGKEGEVWPFQLPDGHWAIPPSALQGMVRSTLEIATLAQLGPWIDDRRFGIRDLSPSAQPIYRGRLGDKAKPGFLYQDGTDWWLKPCKHPCRRIKFDRIPRGNGHPQWSQKSEASKRYQWVSSVGPWRAVGNDRLVTRLQLDATGDAWLVITGNTGVHTKPKSGEFVFEEEDDKIFRINPVVVRDFRFIHEGYGSADPDDWNDAWRYFLEKGYPVGQHQKSFRDGGRIPVFYLEDEVGDIAALGLARMFKLSHASSTHDLLRLSHSDHIDETKLDLPSLIFGKVASRGVEAGLKRRASFDLAVCSEDAHQLVEFERTVLLSPKPSYFPAYIRQARAENGDDRLAKYRYRDEHGNERSASEPYATYTPLGDDLFNVENIDGHTVRRREHEKPELAGVKVWPARGGTASRTRSPYLDENKSRKVSTTLRALPGGATFFARLRFHNLRPVELGALLWALSFGDKIAWSAGSDILKEIPRRHRLGMGKPFGLGEIGIAIRRLTARDMSGSAISNSEKLVEKFVQHMDSVYAVRAGKTELWQASVQVQTLMAVADPAYGATHNTQVRTRAWNQNEWSVHRLDYMELNPERRDNSSPPIKGWNDFAEARSDQHRNAHFMKRYAMGHELDRPITATYSPAPEGDGKFGLPGGADRKFKINDRVQSKKGMRGVVKGLPEAKYDDIYHVLWDGQKSTQRVNERNITPI